MMPSAPARDLFLDHASAILDTATTASGQEDWTILVGRDGALQMLSATDWPLDSLARERGARMAFRVTHENGRVRVDGCQGLRTCCFTSEAQAAGMQRLLSAPAMYRLA